MWNWTQRYISLRTHTWNGRYNQHSFYILLISFSYGIIIKNFNKIWNFLMIHVIVLQILQIYSNTNKMFNKYIFIFLLEEIILFKWWTLLIIEISFHITRILIWHLSLKVHSSFNIWTTLTCCVYFTNPTWEWMRGAKNIP